MNDTILHRNAISKLIDGEITYAGFVTSDTCLAYNLNHCPLFSNPPMRNLFHTSIVFDWLDGNKSRLTLYPIEALPARVRASGIVAAISPAKTDERDGVSCDKTRRNLN